MKKSRNWKVKAIDNDRYTLEYLPNVMGVNGAIIQINKIVYNHALSSNISLKELFDLYDLKTEKKLAILKPEVTNKLKMKTSEDDKIKGLDFFLIKRGDRTYIRYRLARHGDGVREFEINQEVFNFARQQGISTSDILKEFNLYHLDIETNDV